MEQRVISWDIKNILWGLTDQNTNEEVTEKAFDLIGKIRFMPTATVNNGQPENRIIDFNRLTDGNLYFMTSKGKPFYKQLSERPELVINTLIDDNYSLKLRAWVKEETRPEIWDEFFALNPGTKKMYRKNFDIVELYKLEKGEGEMFHLYAEERIRRARFAFGGAEKLPMSYYIDADGCTGCGICQENCVEQAIYQTESGVYAIRDMDCDDCGICYTRCPLAGTALKSRIE